MFTIVKRIRRAAFLVALAAAQWSFAAPGDCGNPERLVNFAYRAHHLMAQTAKRIVAAYYTKPATRAYYSGCSSGGWEGIE